jgi:hypothetical protein
MMFKQREKSYGPEEFFKREPSSLLSIRITTKVGIVIIRTRRIGKPDIQTKPFRCFIIV